MTNRNGKRANAPRERVKPVMKQQKALIWFHQGHMFHGLMRLLHVVFGVVLDATLAYEVALMIPTIAIDYGNQVGASYDMKTLDMFTFSIFPVLFLVIVLGGVTLWLMRVVWRLMGRVTNWLWSVRLAALKQSYPDVFDDVVNGTNVKHAVE